jgi:hypothetical protein
MFMTGATAAAGTAAVRGLAGATAAAETAAVRGLAAGKRQDQQLQQEQL